MANKSQASCQRSTVQRAAGWGHAAFSDRSPSRSIVIVIIDLKEANKRYTIHNKRGRQACTGKLGPNMIRETSCFHSYGDKDKKTNEGGGNKVLSTTYTHRHLSNRRNKNRIRKRLAGRIRTMERTMDASDIETKRELEELFDLLQKYQRGTKAPAVAPVEIRSWEPIIMDSQILQEFEARIKVATWEIWEGVIGASRNRFDIFISFTFSDITRMLLSFLTLVTSVPWSLTLFFSNAFLYTTSATMPAGLFPFVIPSISCSYLQNDIPDWPLVRAAVNQ